MYVMGTPHAANSYLISRGALFLSGKPYFVILVSWTFPPCYKSRLSASFRPLSFFPTLSTFMASFTVFGSKTNTLFTFESRQCCWALTHSDECWWFTEETRVAPVPRKHVMSRRRWMGKWTLRIHTGKGLGRAEDDSTGPERKSVPTSGWGLWKEVALVIFAFRFGEQGTWKTEEGKLFQERCTEKE